MRIKVNVTKSDIARGKRGHCQQCPVALALRGTLEDGFKVRSTRLERRKRFRFLIQDMRRFPQSVIRFINRFDTKGRRAVLPFSFVLDIPRTWLAAQ